MEKALKVINNDLPFDPRAASLNNFLVITFAKNRTNTYPLAVSVARGASQYAETEINKQMLHLAVFSNTTDDVERALALTNYLLWVKNIGIFIKGRFIKDCYKILSVLQCYSEASKCTDYKAHCHSVMEDPLSDKYPDAYELAFHITLDVKETRKPILVQRYVFPCQYLRQYFKFQIDHPSSPEDQIQSGGIVRSCDWCPNFQPKDFRRLPAKTIYPNGKVLIEGE